MFISATSIFLWQPVPPSYRSTLKKADIFGIFYSMCKDEDTSSMTQKNFDTSDNIYYYKSLLFCAMIFFYNTKYSSNARWTKFCFLNLTPFIWHPSLSHFSLKSNETLYLSLHSYRLTLELELLISLSVILFVKNTKRKPYLDGRKWANDRRSGWADSCFGEWNEDLKKMEMKLYNNRQPDSMRSQKFHSDRWRTQRRMA